MQHFRVAGFLGADGAVNTMTEGENEPLVPSHRQKPEDVGLCDFCGTDKCCYASCCSCCVISGTVAKLKKKHYLQYNWGCNWQSFVLPWVRVDCVNGCLPCGWLSSWTISGIVRPKENVIIRIFNTLVCLPCLSGQNDIAVDLLPTNTVTVAKV
jgi:hypothetical protein